MQDLGRIVVAAAARVYILARRDRSLFFFDIRSHQCILLHAKILRSLNISMINLSVTEVSGGDVVLRQVVSCVVLGRYMYRYDNENRCCQHSALDTGAAAHHTRFSAAAALLLPVAQRHTGLPVIPTSGGENFQPLAIANSSLELTGTVTLHESGKLEVPKDLLSSVVVPAWLYKYTVVRMSTNKQSKKATHIYDGFDEYDKRNLYDERTTTQKLHLRKRHEIFRLCGEG